MDLNFRQLGDPEHPHVVIVHGLFGSASNWQSIARKLQNAFCLWLVDLRNHGDSPHSDTMDYPAMADDLAAFVERHCGGSACLIGHSMGGKASLAAALRHSGAIRAVMAMDSAPLTHRSGFAAYTRAMMDIDLTRLDSRADADSALAPVIPERGIRDFLLQNLRRGDQGWQWRLNLPVVAAALETVSGFPAIEGRFDGPVMFLRGGDSDYVPDDIVERCAPQFPKATMATIANAGHWLHAQQPQQVTDAIIRFLAA
ncbi:MAG: alpha/beta fold hydrolase [Pseudomonadota bacterium]